MDNQELYKMYFDELKSLSDAYFGFEITMSLAILTVIGWFITSEKAQKVISVHKYSINVFITTVILTAVAELFVVYRIKTTLHYIHDLVGEISSKLDPVLEEKYYSYKNISLETIIVFYLFHLILFALLCFIIIKLKKK